MLFSSGIVAECGKGTHSPHDFPEEEENWPVSAILDWGWVEQGYQRKGTNGPMPPRGELEQGGVWTYILIYIHLQGLQQSLGFQPLEAWGINLANPQDKFVDEMQRIITSRKKVSIKKDQGWYSEAEMKGDLKWAQHLGLNWKTIRQYKEFALQLWILVLKLHGQMYITLPPFYHLGAALLQRKPIAVPKNELTITWGLLGVFECLWLPNQIYSKVTTFL